MKEKKEYQHERWCEMRYGDICTCKPKKSKEVKS